jgi:adenylate kinase
MWITLLGEPGAGKTTVGQRLAADGRALYISGSTLLDRHIASEPPGWEMLRDAKMAGMRADPALTHQLLRSEAAQVPDSSVVLLDGFPKTVSEVELTETNLPNGAIDLAIFLDARPAVRLERITGRMVCDKCGLVVGDGLRDSESHPSCGGELAAREDDHLDVIMHRHREDLTDPLVEYFGASRRLVRLDAERAATEVQADVLATIETFRKEAT